MPGAHCRGHGCTDEWKSCCRSKRSSPQSGDSVLHRRIGLLLKVIATEGIQPNGEYAPSGDRSEMDGPDPLAAKRSKVLEANAPAVSAGVHTREHLESIPVENGNLCS